MITLDATEKQKDAQKPSNLANVREADEYEQTQTITEEGKAADSASQEKANEILTIYPERQTYTMGKKGEFGDEQEQADKLAQYSQQNNKDKEQEYNGLQAAIDQQEQWEYWEKDQCQQILQDKMEEKTKTHLAHIRLG